MFGSRFSVVVCGLVLALLNVASADPPVQPMSPPKPLPAVPMVTAFQPDTLVALANVQLDAAQDEQVNSAKRDALLDAARRGFLKVLEQDPRHKAALLGLARYYKCTGDRDRAMATYKRCATLNPQDSDVVCEVANAHIQWEDWAGAVAWCVNALKLDPENIACRKTMAFCLARAGKWEEGFAVFCQIMPPAQARYNMARVLEHLNKHDAAREQLRLSVKADPNFAQAREYLVELEKAVVPAAPVTATVSDLMCRFTQGVPAKGETDSQLQIQSLMVKVPVGFCERLRLKSAGDLILSERELCMLLEAAQGHSEAAVTRFPKVTICDGQTATVRIGDRKAFVTGLELTSVDGVAGFTPKTTSVELGDTLKIGGQVSSDRKSVSFHAELTRIVESLPVAGGSFVGSLTPVFEGGSMGPPVPIAQEMRLPNLKTTRIEKTATVPCGGTVVLGIWKESAEKSDPKAVKAACCAAEFEVIALATVQILGSPAPAGTAGGAMVQLKNVAAADASDAVNKYLEGKKQNPTLSVDPVTNTVLVAGDPTVKREVIRLLVALDSAPAQVHIQALVMQTRPGFLSDCGLTDDTPGSRVLTLTERERNVLQMQIRRAKGQEGLNILSRPQMQVADNQTGFIQVGQNFPYLASSVTAAGTTTQAIEYQHVGLTMRVTPRINPDGKVLMRVEPTICSVSPTSVDLGNGIAAPAFTIETVQMTVLASDGQTVILHGLSVPTYQRNPDDGAFTAMAKMAASNQRDDVIIVLTPHLIRNEPPVAETPVTPQPVPARVGVTPNATPALPRSIPVAPPLGSGCSPRWK